MDPPASKETSSTGTPSVKDATQDARSPSQTNPLPSSFVPSPAGAGVQDGGHLNRKKHIPRPEEPTDRSDNSRWASRESDLKASLDEDGRPEWLRNSKSSNAEIAKNLEAARQEMLKISDIVMASYPKNGWLPPLENPGKK